MPIADQDRPGLADRRPLRIGDWLWRPVSAKLWWTAVPLYWGGMAASEHVQALGAFYDSAAAGFLTFFFFPPLVAAILCFGFFRKWLVAQPHADCAADFSHEPHPGADSYARSGMQCDPLNPESGVFWIGNPLNPSHPSNINRAS